MEHKRIKIKEGVYLTVITDEKFKKDLTSVTFTAGEGDDAAVCSTLLTSVMSRSCRKYPSLMLINRELDDLYDAHLTSDSARRGFTHLPSFSISSLNNRYSLDGTDIRGGCLDLLYSVITEPDLKTGYFDAAVLSSEKEQLTDAVNGIKNSRSRYALRSCLEQMMKDEPRFAPRLGRLEKIDGVTPASLTGFYLDMIKTSPVNIVSVGASDDGRVYDFARKLGEFLGDREERRVVEAEFEKAPENMIRYDEELPVTQDVLCVGCTYDGRYGDGLNAARALFGEIFFQNPTSRLFENVREKLSLCYYCSASAMTDLKKLIIYAGIDGKNRRKAEDEILNQTDLIKKSVTEDEISRCKLALKNDLLSVTDSASRTASWYAMRALYGDIETVGEFWEKIERQTKEDVLRAASSVTPYFIYDLKGCAADENGD